LRNQLVDQPAQNAANLALSLPCLFARFRISRFRRLLRGGVRLFAGARAQVGALCCPWFRLRPRIYFGLRPLGLFRL
jgi:hypothetical protein